MKKHFVLLTLALTFAVCMSPEKTIAYTTFSIPISLPITIDSHTFTDVLIYPGTNSDQNTYYDFYNHVDGALNYNFGYFEGPRNYITLPLGQVWGFYYCGSGASNLSQCTNSSYGYSYQFYTFNPFDPSNNATAFFSNYLSTQSITGSWGTISANLSSSGSPKLTINIDPIEGGSVTDGGTISCNVATSEICQYPLSQVFLSTLQANANCDYAFGYWKETVNPHSLTPSMGVGKTITAKFFKTFRNAVGSFNFAIDENRGDRGECVLYVRDETNIPTDACHGHAMDCLGLAQSAGYSIGSEPKIGAIAVFSRDVYPSVGHVGIVKETIDGTHIKLRHSNFSAYHTVSEEVIDLTEHPVMGYIYTTP